MGTIGRCYVELHCGKRVSPVRVGLRNSERNCMRDDLASVSPSHALRENLVGARRQIAA